MNIRKAKITDLPVLVAIYNQAILAGQTADTKTLSLTERKLWFGAHQKEAYPLYVIESATTIMGYATLSPYRNERPALRFVVEVSYYLDQAYQGQGFGAKILAEMIKVAEQLDFTSMVAILLDANIPSIKLLEKFGFEKWGHLPEVAMIDGQWIGHCYYGKKINLSTEL